MAGQEFGGGGTLRLCSEQEARTDGPDFVQRSEPSRTGGWLRTGLMGYNSTYEK